MKLLRERECVCVGFKQKGGIEGGAEGGVAEAVRGGEISPFLCEERETKRQRERVCVRESFLIIWKPNLLMGFESWAETFFRFTLLFSTFFFFFPIFEVDYESLTN